MLRDINFILGEEGVTVMGLYFCKIVGWAMVKTVIKYLLFAVLEIAYMRQKPDEGLINHSEKGCITLQISIKEGWKNTRCLVA